MIRSNFNHSLEDSHFFKLHVEDARKRLDELIDRAVAGERVIIALDDEHLVQIAPVFDH